MSPPRQMTEAGRAALRQALVAAIAAMVVGAFHVPQSFLAVLVAQLLGGLACPTVEELFRRILSAFAGSLAGLAILALAPNEQWISLPLFFILAGQGTVFALRRHGPACGILFGIGIVSMFAESFVFPARDTVFGFAHLFSLLTATLVTALAGRVFFRGTTTFKIDSPDHGAPFVIGAAVVCGLLAACTFLPAQLNVTTVSSFSMALALTSAGGGVVKKILGALLGILTALVFLIPVNGSVNDLAFFLLGLSAVIGFFEWLAMKQPANAVVFRQAAAIFAVVATILPRPDRFMTDSIERMCAGVLGMCVGSVCFLIYRSLPPPAADRLQKG